MNVSLLKVGHCFHPEAVVVRGGSWKAQQFPAIVALIQHPVMGNILFDTGYAKHFQNKTEAFPQRFYRWMTPMHLCDKENLAVQLQERGISTEDIHYIFISHFHADHIAGLLDFPRAKFICSHEAAHCLRERHGFKALLKGLLPDLLPEDFWSRAQFIESFPQVKLPRHYFPFRMAYDICGQGAMFAISLPGHAFGHFGLLLAERNKSLFLVGDACWTEDALTHRLKPHPIAHLILEDKKAYYETMENLAQLHGANQSLAIIPSHCQKSFERFSGNDK